MQQTHARKLFSEKSHTHRAGTRVSSIFALKSRPKCCHVQPGWKWPPPKAINFNSKVFFGFNKHAQPLSCPPTCGNRLHGGHSEWESAIFPTPEGTKWHHFYNLKPFPVLKKNFFAPPNAARTHLLCNRFSVPISSELVSSSLYNQHKKVVGHLHLLRKPISYFHTNLITKQTPYFDVSYFFKAESLE